MISWALKRPPLLALILTILAVAFLCRLGFWQLERLSWKAQVLAQIAAEEAKDPLSLRLGVQDFEGEDGFVRGSVAGVFLHDKEIALLSQVQDGEVGYHLITPFKIKGTSEAVLVNRGWVPMNYIQRSIDRPAGEQIITGFAAPPPRGNMFTPANVPNKAQWYSITPEAIFTARNLAQEGITKLWGPKILLADSGGSHNLPRAQPILARPNNNHAQYALFWFTMAGVLVVIFALRFMRAD